MCGYRLEIRSLHQCNDIVFSALGQVVGSAASQTYTSASAPIQHAAIEVIIILNLIAIKKYLFLLIVRPASNLKYCLQMCCFCALHNGLDDGEGKAKNSFWRGSRAEHLKEYD